MKLHWDILDKRRLKLLPAFAGGNAGFYLAGGTGLALQLGHRTSLDFDFYSPEDFDPMALARQLTLPPKQLKVTSQTKGTLLGFADKKYPTFDAYNGLRGLLFFEEAEKEKPRLGIRLKQAVLWTEVKAFFLKTVQAQLGKPR